ncbi:hypothetical protein BDFB_011103, partial [Asbolus verrucosus]
TNVSVHVIVPVVFCICIFYTAIGGLKTIIWTDTLQFVITVGTLGTVCTLGVNSVGGFTRVWSKAITNKRLDIFESVIYYTLGICVVKTACVLIGLILHAKYAECDPFKTKEITRKDQLLPYYVMDIARDIPGLSGIFIAGIFSASLSCCYWLVVYFIVNLYLDNFLATGIDARVVTLVTCSICIFYTTTGELKIGIWTDALQLSYYGGFSGHDYSAY